MRKARQSHLVPFGHVVAEVLDQMLEPSSERGFDIMDKPPLGWPMRPWQKKRGE
jgi:hypothetical protein